MRKREAVAQIRDEIDSALEPDVQVRTSGYDPEASPPEVILEPDSSRLQYEGGHINLGGIITDDSGYEVEREFHQYYTMNMDVTVRSENEGRCYDILAAIQDHFSPYEFDASSFHDDTTEWVIGDIAQRSNPVLEPDWYEFGFPLRFKYVRKTSTTEDTLTDVPTTVDEESDTLDDGEITIE